jgi:hypothetical protein
VANGGALKMLCVLDEHTRECLNQEWFVTRREAKVVIEKWRQFYQ